MIGVQTPRIWSVPEYVSSTGPEAIELCAMAGLILDPWQEFVLTNSLGERADGKWASFEVGLNVARQNGKDAVLEARELTGLFLLGEKLIVHSAHQFDTSLEHFRRLLYLIESTPDFDKRVLRVSRSHGEEGVELKGGQRIRFRTRTKGGGRGFTGDLLVLNEAMILPDSFMGALLPTLSAKSITGNPQVIYAGSPVDQTIHEHGFQFARVRKRGIKGDPSLAYFEHSAAGPGGEELTPDRVTPEIGESVEAWAQANPGLGIRISEEHIRNELRTLGLREFAVERLGVGDWPDPDAANERVIDPAAWDALADTGSKVADPVCFAFSTSFDRAWSSIGVAGKRRDGLGHVEVIDRRRGTGWLIPRLLELRDTHGNVGFVCDGKGPAGSLLPEIEKAGLEVKPVTADEYAQGCGMIYDAVDQKTMRHMSQADLNAAVRTATKRPLGERWAWSRKGGTDISPLEAVTLAHWGWHAAEVDVDPEPMVAVR